MARRKRKPEQEEENHERWLVSYADFITLLFAFFVVMYSVSSVNEGKYRVLSETLTEAFKQPMRSSEPIQVGEVMRTPLPTEGQLATLRDEGDSGANPPALAHGTAAQASTLTSANLDYASDLSVVQRRLRSSLSDFMERGLVDLEGDGNRIEVRMKSKMLFESGSARISRDALTALSDVAGILEPIGNPLRIEGHTDNVPINTPQFPSNWELSSARAASVVHFFMREGVAARRLAAIGYGEHRPIADNTTEEGRQRNRRVTLLILAKSEDEAASVMAPPAPVAVAAEPQLPWAESPRSVD